MQEEKLVFKIIETNLSLRILKVPVKKEDRRFKGGYKIIGSEYKVGFTGSLTIKDPSQTLKIGDFVGNQTLGVFKCVTFNLGNITCLPMELTTQINKIPNPSDYNIYYLGRTYTE